MTTNGEYGTRLEFTDGLVVIWGDNSKGKSLCVKAILVALGMEAMLSTQQAELPLPPAVTKVLESEGESHAVLESEVFLEIENNKGRRITTHRTIKGARHHNLITVYDGSLLTVQDSLLSSRDYFVNRPGAATREAGFHNFLADFLEWTLPTVQTYDDRESTLYLQCIFPFLVVEQTRGWASIIPPVPTHFRIRDTYKRALEFLLNLGVHDVALRRQSLILERNRIEGEWRSRRSQAVDLADAIHGVVSGMPERPVAAWPHESVPHIQVPNMENWISLESELKVLESKYRQLTEHEIPRVNEIANSAEHGLVSLESTLADKQVLLSRLFDYLQMEIQECELVQKRLSALDEDIVQNQDAITLRTLGSRRDSLVDKGVCPICHQSLSDALIPLAKEQPVMSLEDNLRFLNEQKRTIRGVLETSEKTVAVRKKQIEALRAEVVELRERVRALKQTLVSDGRTPSLAAVREQLQLESGIKERRQTQERFLGIIEGFSQLSARWRHNLAESSQLPTEDTSNEDRAKVSWWAKSMKQQLERYGFSSVKIEGLSISLDNYRPEHEGFDLQTSISASDVIRTIWAYLYGLMDLSTGHQFRTNHPGFLVFDEPKQQSARDVSFGELLRYTSGSHVSGQQIVFFTSEDRARLATHLQGVSHTFREIDGRFLKKIGR